MRASADHAAACAAAVACWHRALRQLALPQFYPTSKILSLICRYSTALACCVLPYESGSLQRKGDVGTERKPHPL